MKFLKLSSPLKAIYILAFTLIGFGLGNLSKGYKDRTNYLDSLDGLINKSIEGHSRLFESDGNAEVKLNLTHDETHDLYSTQLYYNRFQTKLTRIPYYINLFAIICGFCLTFWIHSRDTEQKNSKKLNKTLLKENNKMA